MIMYLLDISTYVGKGYGYTSLKSYKFFTTVFSRLMISTVMTTVFFENIKQQYVPRVTLAKAGLREVFKK